MKLNDLLCGIEVKKTNIRDNDIEIKGITQNSRIVEDGFIFVAICGEHSDGNLYIPSAVEKGAVVIVTENEPYDKTPYILVENARTALSKLLSAFYSNPEKSFKYSIGITGTNGKTSTTFMLKNIFDAAGYKVGLIGTMKYLIGDEEYELDSNGNHLTTPDAENFYKLLAAMRDKGTEVLIMEVSSHALALDKVAAMHFNVGIFTNLTRDHMDFHKTFEAYRDAKLKLFDMCDIGLINEDDPSGAYMKENAKCKEVYTYSASLDSSDYTAKNVRLKGATGIEYEFLTRNLLFRIGVGIAGNFTVYNSLAAASTALLLGLTTGNIVRGLESIKRVTGRIDRVDIYAPYSVIIDFAHTPDAMINVLKTAKSFTKGRIITVFGCGGDRDKSKRPIMGKIATDMSDIVIVTSDNSRSEEKEDIIRDIMAGITDTGKVKTIVDRTEAIHLAMDIAKENDLILLLGKGHEEYEIDKDGKHPYSERKIVIEYNAVKERAEK